MKKIFTLSILIIALINFNCKKDNDGEKNQIDANNLTTCPKDFNCTYLYQNNANFGDSFFLNLKKGNYRVFKYSALAVPYDYYAQHIYIRVPMNNVTQSFKVTNEQALSGDVQYATICPSCDFIGVKVVGGSFKGVKTSSINAIWLLEGKVYLAATAPSSSYRDTISIKQYFTLDPAGI